MPLKSKEGNLSSYSELKHFTWDEIVEFAEVDRWMASYRTGGSGDWKANGKPGDGYLMVTVGGEPYWTDAIGQIPFAINKFKNELMKTGDAQKAIQKTILIGQKYGDGGILFGKSDFSNSYDNAMIRRTVNWAERRYKAKQNYIYGYDLIKTNFPASNLSIPSR